MRRLIPLLLLACFPIVLALARPALAASPPFAWANVAGTVNDDFGRALAVDRAGNTYVAGSFDGTITFGATTLSSSGGNNRPDLFVAKHNAAGQLEWVRKAGGTGTDLAYGITVDNASNVVITGSSDSTVFTAGTVSSSISGKKIIFLKLDPAGNTLWLRTSLAQAFFPPPDGTGIAAGADAAGNLYFAGHFTGPINFGGTPGVFPPPTGGIAFTNNGDTDIFLLKYDPAGSIIWGRQISGDNLQEVRRIAVTPAGDVYMAGRFNGTANFGGTHLTSGNTSWDTDMFLARWDSAGSLVWVRQVGSNDTDHGLAVAVDAAGAPHLVGTFKGLQLTVGGATYTNSNLSYDLVVAKFSPAGAPQWSMRIERGLILPDEGLGAAIDGNGNVLVTGNVINGATFNNLPYPDGAGSCFVTLIENGDAVWVKRAGASTGDFGAGIGVDAAGNIYVGGTLGRTDPGALAVFDSLTPATAGQRDIFIGKLGSGGSLSGPALSFFLVGTNLSVSWPLVNAAYSLQCSTSLGSAFGPATEPRVTNAMAQMITVTIQPSGPQKFYRLAAP